MNGVVRQDPQYNDDDGYPPPAPETRPIIKASRTVSNNIPPETHYSSYRPGAQRATTFEGPRQLHRDDSPVANQRMARVPSDNVTVKAQRDRLRPLTTRANDINDAYSDPSDDSTFYESPDRPFKERSASPATSHGSVLSRTASYSTLDGATNGKKAPPPPPPSRAKKPPPPPPPMKRSALGTTNVSYA